MVRVSGSLTQYPARAAVVWYAGLIAIGAMVLALPQSVVPGATPLSAIDAIFTATSASCVTGLAVRSTGQELSRLGQATVLVLIQVGGIGIMTITTFVVLRLGGRESLRQRVLLTQTLGSAERDLRIMIWKILRLVFLCEGAGFVLLAIPLFNESGVSMTESLWAALFHSVSAFCNAGFALHDSSLAPYRANWVVNVSVMALIVTGGIGFPVIRDVGVALRSPGSRPWQSLSMHSKMMLIGTVGLLSGGAGLFLFLEWNNVLAGLPLGEKLLVACFQSTTTRTAGFETVPMAQLTNATLFCFMLLMIVGGGPGSTAGGCKVTTLMVFATHAWAKLHGRRGVNFFRRSVAPQTLDAAMATALLFTVVVAVALVAFLVIEHADAPHQGGSDTFLDAAFEVCSALGTVGLSTGITPNLSASAKAVLSC